MNTGRLILFYNLVRYIRYDISCSCLPGSCPAGWFTHNGYCYQFNIQLKRSWQGALEHCSNINSTLMELATPFSDAILFNSEIIYESGVDSLWLGFQSQFY